VRSPAARPAFPASRPRLVHPSIRCRERRVRPCERRRRTARRDRQRRAVERASRARAAPASRPTSSPPAAAAPEYSARGAPRSASPSSSRPQAVEVLRLGEDVEPAVRLPERRLAEGCESAGLLRASASTASERAALATTYCSDRSSPRLLARGREAQLGSPALRGGGGVRVRVDESAPRSGLRRASRRETGPRGDGLLDDGGRERREDVLLDRRRSGRAPSVGLKPFRSGRRSRLVHLHRPRPLRRPRRRVPRPAPCRGAERIEAARTDGTSRPGRSGSRSSGRNVVLGPARRASR
jgi:hypothetical protein